MSERNWYYPPRGWPVHELNWEWYKRDPGLDDEWERGEPNALCREIDQAGISSKRCCSDSTTPLEETERIEVYKAVRFVRGLGGTRYPELWGIEELKLEIDTEPGWAAFLRFSYRTPPSWSTWMKEDGRIERGLRWTSLRGDDDPYEIEDWHYIFIASAEEKQQFLKWFEAFKQKYGFQPWEASPIREHFERMDYYNKARPDDPPRRTMITRWTTANGEPVKVEWPEVLLGKDVRTGETVTIQTNPRFDGYMEFCRAQRLRNASSSAFTFNEEPVLVELEANKTWKLRVEAFRSYLRGRYQDDVAHDLGVGQSTVSTWLGMVRGEVGRRMGAAYEAYLEGSHRLRPDIAKVTRDGAQGRPDLVVELRDGSYEVISAKCFKSDRSTVTVQLEEFQPELNEAHRLTRLGEPVRLLVDYLNLETGQHEVTEISLDNPPQRLNFRKSAG